MDDERFWRLIKRIDFKRVSDEARVAPLVRALARLDEGEIRSFHEHLATKVASLDTAEHFRNAGDVSGDGFLYARLYVVGRGKDFYDYVLKSPKLMPASLELWLEPLLSAAPKAYASKTGRELEGTLVSFESFTNPRFDG